MKNLATLFVALCCIAVLSFIGCIKKADPPIAGKGGTATLVILPQHHYDSKTIDTCKVYIGYNKADIPVYYNDSATCICANGVVTCSFDSLKNGNYYIQGYGHDSSVHSIVKGGIPITIASQTLTTTVALPISEIF